MASRAEMFQAVGISPGLVEQIIVKQMEEETMMAWRSLDEGHGDHRWHVTFHASSFPDVKPCARKRLYGLASIPDLQPISIDGRGIMDAGIDLEHRLVSRLHRSGILLSPPPGSPQWLLMDPKVALAGHPDAVIRVGKDGAVPVEVKGKDHEVVLQMRAGARRWDRDHWVQLQVYIYLCRLNAVSLGISPPKRGSLIYVSRGRPNTRKEFVIEYDDAFIRQGLETLEYVRELFKEGVLPGRSPDWKWTEAPCNWCGVKKLCKADYKASVQTLAESAAVAFAVDHYGEIYEFSEVHKAVLDMWDKLEMEDLGVRGND